MTSGDDNRFDWGRGWAAAGALVAALILITMVVLVAISNQARDAALETERHAYDVNLLTRNVDATLLRSQSALGTFVLDEQTRTSGNIYYSQWRLAGEQIAQLDRLVTHDDAQSRRVDQLEKLYAKRGTEFDIAARNPEVVQLTVGEAGEFAHRVAVAAPRRDLGSDGFEGHGRSFGFFLEVLRWRYAAPHRNLMHPI